MAVEVADIIVGAGTLKLDGTDVGATQDGVTLRRESDYLDITADQARARLAKFETEVRFFVTTTLKQATLENLARLLGQPVPTPSGGTLTLNLGLPTGKMKEYVLTFIGPAPGTYATRTYTIRKAVSISTAEHRYAKDPETTFAAEFECLADLTNPGSEFGTVVDAT